jgi:hypothetical protein
MQTIPAALTTIVASNIKKPNALAKIAWDLDTYDAGADFALIGTATIDGIDVIQGEGAAITAWQRYTYIDESDYIKSWEYTKEADPILVGIIKSRATVVFDNHDGHFFTTSNPNSKAGRFMKIFDGYNGYYIPQFVGIIDTPQHDLSTAETKVEAYDAMTYLENFELDGKLYEGKSRSYIIEDILNDCGFGSSEYFIDTSEGTCPLAWVQQGEKALDIINEICEAEQARFYIDELGYFRWESRYHYAKPPHNASVYQFGMDTNIFKLTFDKDTIVNKCTVKIKPLRWVDPEEMFKLSGQSDSIIIPANGTYEQAVVFDHPTKDLIQPTMGGAYSNFLANTNPDGSGIDVTASVGLVSFVDNGTLAIMTFSNALAQNVYLTSLVIWGTPAKEIPEEIYETPDSLTQDSINEFGIQSKDISGNRFLNTLLEAKAVADWIALSQQGIMNAYTVDCDGIVQLQVGDRVTIIDPISGITPIDVVVYKISKSGDGLQYQISVVEKIPQYEIGTNYAIIGTSTIGGADKLAR